MLGIPEKKTSFRQVTRPDCAFGEVSLLIYPSVRRACSSVLCMAVLLLALVPLSFADGTVRVGVYSNPPKLAFDPQSGRLEGILGELLEEIARREGWRLEPMPCLWEQCLQMLQAGELDLMPDVARSAERATRMAFHETPALRSWSLLFTAGNELPHSPLDLAGKRIAVLTDSIQLGYLQKLLQEFGVSAEFIPVDTLDEAFAAAAQGRADLAVANQLYGDVHAERFGLRPTPILFQPSGLYYATPKGQGEEIRARIDHWLATWQGQQNSFYDQMLRRWSSDDLYHPLPKWLLWGLCALTVLLVTSLLVALRLRRKVGDSRLNLERSEQRMQALLSSLDACIFIKGKDYCYQYVNPRLCELFDRPEEEILGRDDSAFFAPQTLGAVREADRQVLEEGRQLVNEEKVWLLNNEQARSFMVVKQPLRDARGQVTGVVGVATDITERQQAEEKLHRLSFFDPLTGLPNQQQMLDRLEHAMNACTRRGLEGAVLFIDLDNFRDLNDTLGHNAGNQLLVSVAERLSLRIREGDTLARYGGDEFVVVVEDLDPSRDQAVYQVEHLASVLLELIHDAFELEGHLYTPSASIGIALFSDAQQGAADMIKWAELAMYGAKEGGRNRYCFYDPSMQAKASARAALEAGMRQALVGNEFQLYYQPQYNAEGELLGVESLIRWQHPDRGMVSPGDFIPVAEVNGLILPLGRWILEEACQQLVRWADHPRLRGLPIAVNISAQQMHDPGFVETVLEVLAQTGADARLLKLELTESLLVKNIEQIIDKMSTLRDRGVSFSLDDFGTGYSSLSYLKRLPMDQLKIDQGFVRDLLCDPNDEAIVRTVIALGRSLDLTVIAEGVETLEQKQALEAYGCYQFQGYLFGRPLPAARLEAELI